MSPTQSSPTMEQQSVPALVNESDPLKMASSKDLLSDRAYRDIRKLIIDLSLEPGSQISEPGISVLSGHSKASVRSALLRLSQERLLRPIARRGYEVSTLTIQDARNIFQLRLYLEPHAANAAAGRVTKSDFKHLEKSFAAGYSPSDPDSFDDWLAANRELRLLIASASGNARLVHVIAGLLDELERYLRLSFRTGPNRSTQMHKNVLALISALDAGDGKAAGELTHQQLTQTAEAVLNALMTRQEILAQPLTIR